MSASVLLNLLNELWKKENMFGSLNILLLLLFCNKLKFNNT